MIGNVVLGTTSTAIYTVASGSFAMLSLIFCNTTAVDQTINIYASNSSGVLGSDTQIIKNLLLPPEDSFVWSANEKMILATGDKIYGTASNAAAVTCTFNGMVI